MSSKTIIGIDPGKSGGIACQHASGSLSIRPMPETVGDLVDCLREIVASIGECVAYVERVHSSPQMGVVSAFTFGRGLGNIEAVCQCLGIRLVWTNPGDWQKAMSCRTKGDKNITKRRAQELFPALKVTHKVADALLICEYGRRVEGGQS